MGGKGSPVRIGGGGTALPALPKWDVVGDLKNPGNITTNVAGVLGGTTGSSIRALHGLNPGVAQGIQSGADKNAAQAALDAKAAEMGFTDEADRIAKVTNIINSFGKARANKALPAILQSVGNKSGIANKPGIMTKGK